MDLDLIKAALVIIVLFFLLGFLFNVLYKVGIILLIVLGVMYLVKRVFFE